MKLILRVAAVALLVFAAVLFAGWVGTDAMRDDYIGYLIAAAACVVAEGLPWHR